MNLQLCKVTVTQERVLIHQHKAVKAQATVSNFRAFSHVALGAYYVNVCGLEHMWVFKGVF